MPPLRFFLEEEVLAAGELWLAVPRRAQRARAAAASFARVAADMGRRRPSVFAALVLGLLLPTLPPPNKDFSRRSKVSICSRIETASFNLSRDKSMRVSSGKAVGAQINSAAFYKDLRLKNLAAE
jgi:hypothetical protein